MLKKSLVTASLLLACAVAWGVAQDNLGPSILAKPIQSTQETEGKTESQPPSLSNALKSAQQNAVADYSSTSVGEATASVQRSSAEVAEDAGSDFEIPSILSGRKDVKPQPATQPGPAVPSMVQPRKIEDKPELSSPRGGTGLPSSVPPSQLPKPRLAQPIPQQSTNGTEQPAYQLPRPSTLGSPSQPRRLLQPSTTGDATPMALPSTSGKSSPSDVRPRTARTIEIGQQSNGMRPMSMSIPGPSLRVDTVGPGTLSVGKPADFEVVVSNLGSMVAEEVLVAVDFPATVALSAAQAVNGEIEQTDGSKMARVIWTVSDVAAGGEQRLSMKLTPSVNKPFDLDVEWTFIPLAKKTQIQVTQPEIELTIDGPTEVLFGEKANFRFVVTNSGTGAAEDVTVDLPGSLGAEPKNLGTIAAGQTRSFEIEIEAVDAGEVTLGARATADGGLSSEKSLKFVVRRGELNVAIAGPEFKYAGTTATYELIIRNTGDAAAKEVMAAAALPAGAEYIDGISGVEQVDGGIRWNIGQLNPGEQREYSIRCVLNTAGETRFEAGARGAGDLAAANGIATTVEAVADLTLVVEDPKGPKPVGEEVTYTLRIKNRGSKAATSVNLLSQFSDGIEPSKVVGGKAEMVPGQVIFEPIRQIKAGEEVVLEIKAVASADGNHVFRTELTCDTPETRRLFEGTTRYFASARAAQGPPASGGGGFRPSSIQR